MPAVSGAPLTPEQSEEKGEPGAVQSPMALERRGESWLSFYKPNRRGRAIREEEGEEDAGRKKTVESTDLLGRALQFYARLTDWKKLKLYEFAFILVVITVFIAEHDCASMAELFVLSALALPSSLMIPHWCYSVCLVVECVSMILKYSIQLPFLPPVRQLPGPVLHHLLRSGLCGQSRVGCVHGGIRGDRELAVPAAVAAGHREALEANRRIGSSA